MNSPVLSRLALISIFALSSPACGTHSKPASDMSHGHEGHDHHGAGESAEAPGELVVTTDPTKPKAQEVVKMRLMLHDSNGQMLKDFERVHEKLAHFIVVREGLDQFAHLHPTIDPSGMMSVEYTFPVGGTYHFFLDHKPKGRPQSVAKAMVQVEGDAPQPPPLVANVPGHVRGDGLDADVTVTPSADSSAQTMTFLVKETSGKTVNDLEPYLGAMGHLVVLSADAKKYVHAHPKDVSSADGKVHFEVHFPNAGLYKTWGQFQRGGKVYTIPAVVQVGAAQRAH